MKAFQASILFSALLLALSACQSTSYRVKGTVEGMEDGDTLYLTTDLMDGYPSDTIIVKDGKFSLEGQADSVQLAMIYSASRNELNANLFLEPGDITVTISEQPGMSRVGGTGCNDQWQQLNDSVIAIGRRINLIAEHIYGNQVSQEEQAKGMAQIEHMEKHFAEIVVRSAERNIKNEFGYFLLTYYPEELLDNATRLRLIEQLPDNMRQRPAVLQIEQAIKEASKTTAGNTLPDFSQPAPDGTMLSIREETAKHQLTIIDFWASWCGPCRQEMPLMVELYQQYKDKGLGIVGVSLDSHAADWTTAIQKLNMMWPQMSDLKGWDNAAAKLFSINSIPHTIVVDQKGVILHRGLRGEELRKFVAEQLK